MNKSENEKSETRFADLASVFGFENEGSISYHGSEFSDSEFSDSEISDVVENVVSGELAVWEDEEDENGFLSQLGVEFDSLAVNGLVDSNSPNVDEEMETEEEELPEETKDDES